MFFLRICFNKIVTFFVSIDYTIIMLRADIYFFFIICILTSLIMGCPGMKANQKNQNIPECRTCADVQHYDGKAVIINGWYEVEPVPGGKRLQAASVVLPDGTRLIHSYRPVKEMFCYINKRVTVRGIVRTDAGEPPEVQQVMAPHIAIESMALAPDEKPYDSIPDRIPDLPFIEEKKEMMRWNDRWVHVYGKLVGLKLRYNESIWADAIIRLRDDTRLCVEWVSFSRWNHFLDNEVTVTLLLKLGKEEAGVLHTVSSRTAICSGKVPRCGMSD
jgi:hypothetical protein